MEPIKKEAILAWVAKHDWFLINEHGQQSTYLTPTGEICIVSCDLSGNMESAGKLMPAPAAQGRQFGGGLDLKGGRSPFFPP